MVILCFHSDSVMKFSSLMMMQSLQKTCLEGPITSVAYCPLTKLTLLAVTMEVNKMILTNSYCGDRHRITATTEYLSKLRCEASESDILEWTYEGKGRMSINLGYVGSILNLCIIFVFQSLLLFELNDTVI